MFFLQPPKNEEQYNRNMSNKHGPPKHQNSYAWKPNAGHKINEKEVGGRLRPLSEITGVCQRCREQIDWKRRYGKYKPLSQPAKCQRCSKRAVRQAYHSLCPACAKEQHVCAKCCCRVDRIIGRDLAEVEAEKKVLEEAIKNSRERDRRALLRAMNKGASKSSTKLPSNDGNKVGDLFPSASLEEYAAKGGDQNRKVNGHNDQSNGADEEEYVDDNGDGDDDDNDDSDDNNDNNNSVDDTNGDDSIEIEGEHKRED